MFGQNVDKRHLSPQAGIAIGPILFIIAILAILAAAIAAGSGSFTSGTNSESSRTKSSALVQIGENLKIGMDRITMEGGIDPTSVDINVTNTAATNALFSPVGGGIAAPSVGMANNPVYDKWYFPKGPINGMGTSVGSIVAVLPVSLSVCAEINNRTVGTAVAPTTAALGDFAAGTITGATLWPTAASGGESGAGTTVSAGANLVGVATGCVQTSDVTVGTNASPTSQYFYYQVLAIQ
jgi:hypothetical protein